MNARNQKDDRQAILVVDDDIGVREVFAEILDEGGYRVQVAPEADSATKIVKKQVIDLALVDIWLKPGIDGIELIKQWHETGLLNFPLAVISGHAEVPTAVQAMRYGAIDVLTKPIGSKLLLEFVNKTLSKQKKPAADVSLLQRANLGTSAASVAVKGKLLKAAGNGNAVLFVGQHNAGCEFFARLLHMHGKPWLELRDLGFLASAPTAPLAQLSHGTLYLRNIDDLSEIQQRGLVQLLHNATNQSVRVLAESEKTAEELKDEGKFSDELAQLFGHQEISIPSIKDYVGSLPGVAKEAGRIYALAYGFSPDSFSDGALQAINKAKSRWFEEGLAGLLSLLKALLHSSLDGRVDENLANKYLVVTEEGVGQPLAAAGMGMELLDLPLREARTNFEKLYFQNLIEKAGHNYAEAARIAKLERSYLYRKIKTLLGEEDSSAMED